MERPDNHHFVKLSFLDAWREVVRHREAEVFPRLAAERNGELHLTVPMAYVEAVAA